MTTINDENFKPLSEGVTLYPGQRVIKIGNRMFPVGIGNNAMPATGGMDFYKCAAVYGPRKVKCYVISGCPTAAVNGTYMPTEFTTEDGGGNKQPVYFNGTYYYYYNSTDMIWCISGDYSSYNWMYYGEGSSWSDSNWDGVSGMTGVESTAIVDADALKTWDGYKAVFDAESETWSFAADVTEGLTYGENIVPAIGKIYNDTVTIMAVLYQGYPENALFINCDTLTADRFTATNCTLSTDIKKYGTGSIKINSGGYIKFDHGMDSLLDIPWTVAHFFYADSYTGNELAPLVNNDDDGQGAFFISISSDGTLRSNIRAGSTDYRISEALTAGWHHLRVSYTGNGTLRIYLDGTFIHSVSGFVRNTESFWIGELGYLDSSRQFDGYIDGIEFIPLDESTIIQYSGDTAPVPKKEFATSGDNGDTDNVEPVFYASLSEAKATAETGQSLTASGNVTYSTVDGVPCATLDGSSYISTSDAGFPTRRSARSVSMLVSKGESYSDTTILSYGSHAANKRYGIGFSGSHLEIWGMNNTTSFDYAFQDDKWYHVVVTLSGTAEKLYVDGELTEEVTHNNLNTVLGELCIGVSAVDHTEYFIGRIAAVRIYDRVLSEAEIADLANEFSI